MNIAQISFYLDPQARAPRQLLRDWPSLAQVAGAVAAAEHRVTVIQASQHRENFRESGVDYHFLPPGEEFTTLLSRLAPDAVHVHGLGFGAAVSELRDRMPGLPILLQDHADRPPHFWRRRIWRRGFEAADGVSFCARPQATPFLVSGLLTRHCMIFEIPECTSDFTPGDQQSARQETGLYGDPCVLWVGHLNSNKDPLTVLAAVSEAVEKLPGIQLWCCFGSAPLRTVIEQRIADDSNLQGRVHLLGTVPHARIEQLMRAADLYVSASHREGSGYALIESLACGLPVVVSDIPAFRVLSGAGRAGRLWQRGDPRSLTAALIEMAAQPRPQARSAARAQFEACVSRTAIGAGFAAAYRQLAERRTRA